MPNITITNNDIGSVVLDLWGAQDGVLENAELTEQTFAAGTLLALHATDGHLYPYDPADATGEDLEIPKFVLTYEVTIAASDDAPVTVLNAGRVNKNRLLIHDGTTLTAAMVDQLLNRSIIPVDVKQLALIDNPQS